MILKKRGASNDLASVTQWQRYRLLTGELQVRILSEAFSECPRMWRNW
jgi:hypothetical protein